jgi:radical SAM protein with 4Fe4S-binding SPASM domain
MRARIEPFGAWVRVGDGTLVAVSRPLAARFGLDGGAVWGDASPAPSRPLEVHVAVTARCPAGCGGCYLDARPDGEAPPFDELAARLRAVAGAGAFTVAFGGGEPLTRPDLGRLAEAARALGLTPVVTTSGLGLTADRAATLRAFAQVNVSYDGGAGDYAAVRGWEGADVAERAMRSLAAAGVPFGVNVVLTRASFPRLDRTLARAAELGAREAQLLRYKPAGRAKSPDYLATRLSPEQVLELHPTLERLARETHLSIRIDCALLPLLSARDVDPVTLERFGVLGCEAGRHLAAARVDGALAPCSFAPATALGVLEAWSGDAPDAWAGDPTLSAWRAPHDAEPCRSCSLREACRGGCRVVAEHLRGALEPDPECPRVRAHRARAQAQPAAGVPPEGGRTP